MSSFLILTPLMNLWPNQGFFQIEGCPGRPPMVNGHLLFEKIKSLKIHLVIFYKYFAINTSRVSNF